MIKSIQQFSENGVKILEKEIEKFYEDPKNQADFVYGITKGVMNLGLSIISEILEEMDEELRESGKRKVNWKIVKKDKTSLITSLGVVYYRKTLFIHKETKERLYLLDQLMGLESHTRMTEDAEAKILEEAVETSYQKGGKNVSLTENVSKQTVKNKIHKLKNFPIVEERKEKKKVKILYINADEDHVSAQFNAEKGDLEVRNGRKYNTIMPKLVYVYEDTVIDKDSEKVTKPRYKLKNPYFFGGVYEGKQNETLWKEVQEYIENVYDCEYLEKIYLMGDGARWIKAGCSYVDKSIFVLDTFHRNKYINQSISHMMDSKSDAWDRITDCFSMEDKKELHRIYLELEAYALTESKKQQIKDAKKYLLNNWKGIVIYNNKGHEIKGCSAEGHISHIYASRMSSRPLGWSKIGADKMARLRIYYYNGGDMLKLVRKQKDALPLAAGCEILSSCKILGSERNKNEEIGKYVDLLTHKISSGRTKRRRLLKEYIWEL